MQDTDHRDPTRRKMLYAQQPVPISISYRVQTNDVLLIPYYNTIINTTQLVHRADPIYLVHT